MRKGFVISEAIIIAVISAIFGMYAQKQTNVTQYIYNADENKTTILWIDTNAD